MLQAKVVDISSSSFLFSVSSLPFPLRSLEHISLCPVQLAYYVRSTHFDVPHKSQTFLAKRGERRFFPPGFNVLKFEYKWPQRGVNIPLEKSFLLLGISKFAPVKLTPTSILFLLLYQNNHLLSFFVTSRCLRQTTRRLFPFSPEENHAYPQRVKGHLFISWKYQQTTNFWKLFSDYFAPTSKFVTFREVSPPIPWHHWVPVRTFPPGISDVLPPTKGRGKPISKSWCKIDRFHSKSTHIWKKVILSLLFVAYVVRKATVTVILNYPHFRFVDKSDPPAPSPLFPHLSSDLFLYFVASATTSLIHGSVLHRTSRRQQERGPLSSSEFGVLVSGSGSVRVIEGFFQSHPTRESNRILEIKNQNQQSLLCAVCVLQILGPVGTHNYFGGGILSPPLECN